MSESQVCFLAAIVVLGVVAGGLVYVSLLALACTVAMLLDAAEMVVRWLRARG